MGVSTMKIYVDLVWQCWMYVSHLFHIQIHAMALLNVFPWTAASIWSCSSFLNNQFNLWCSFSQHSQNEAWFCLRTFHLIYKLTKWFSVNTFKSSTPHNVHFTEYCITHQSQGACSRPCDWHGTCKFGNQWDLSSCLIGSAQRVTDTHVALANKWVVFSVFRKKTVTGEMLKRDMQMVLGLGLLCVWTLVWVDVLLSLCV